MPTQPRVFSPSIATSSKTHLHTDNAATYRTTANSISVRPKVGSVAWAPPAWNTVKESGAAQLTPELKTIAQAVVDRAGWRRGNAMAFMVSGTGRRNGSQVFRGADLRYELELELERAVFGTTSGLAQDSAKSLKSHDCDDDAIG